MQKISHIKGLRQCLDKIIEQILNKVAEETQHEIDEALERYYEEYDPAKATNKTIYYHRTNQLLHSCEIQSATIEGNKVKAKVFLNISNLQYTQPGADAYKTAVAANAGLHGGWNHQNTASGQVPWDSISSNDGTKLGSGTQIWEEPIERLFGEKKLIDIFIAKAQEYGLNLTRK